MCVLHKFNQSPFSTLNFQNTLPLIKRNDKILFTEDAVLICQHSVFNALQNEQYQVYFLEDDLTARGINPEDIPVVAISYAEFVQLCVESDKVISW